MFKVGQIVRLKKEQYNNSDYQDWFLGKGVAIPEMPSWRGKIVELMGGCVKIKDIAGKASGIFEPSGLEAAEKPGHFLTKIFK